jgi:hypothetical protein
MHLIYVLEGAVWNWKKIETQTLKTSSSLQSSSDMAIIHLQNHPKLLVQSTITYVLYICTYNPESWPESTFPQPSGKYANRWMTMWMLEWNIGQKMKKSSKQLCTMYMYVWEWEKVNSALTPLHSSTIRWLSYHRNNQKCAYWIL